MIAIQFKFNGKEINPDTVDNFLTKAFIESISNNIQHELKDIICPIHEEYPSVVAEGNSVDELSYNINGCCESLIQTAKNKLN